MSQNKAQQTISGTGLAIKRLSPNVLTILGIFFPLVTCY